MLLFLILMMTVLLWFYTWLYRKYNYWPKRGVATTEVKMIFGNHKESTFMKRTVGEEFQDIYNAFPYKPIVGYYSYWTPGLLVRDPELIRKVLVTDFDSFHDNEFETDQKKEPLLGRNPFVLSGDKWKKVRVELAPAFTSAKIKAMFPLVEEVCNNMVDYLVAEPNNLECIDAKLISTKYTTDVVASCIFGLDAKSFTDLEAQFLDMGLQIIHPDHSKHVIMMAVWLFPILQKFVNTKLMPQEVEDFFTDIVHDTLTYRKENRVKRNDFFNHLIHLKSVHPELTELDLAAHAITFFTDGFETSSTIMSYALYEMGRNPEIQQKLREELRESCSRTNGHVTYETINDLTYLNAVVLETLRIHPPVMSITRKCTKPYVFEVPRNDSTKVCIEEGTSVTISVYGLHHDAKYFPNPEKFDPSRFSDEAKAVKGNRMVYLPFGDGPRICLGMRFALAQVKAGLASLVAEFNISVSPKTQEPLKQSPHEFLMSPLGGIWLNLKRIRTKQD